MGIFTVDTASGRVEQVLDERGLPGYPHLSGDGTKLAFLSWRDLDRTVGNEDLNAEVYLLDLDTREIVQVTDTINHPSGPGIWATNTDGQVLALDSPFELNGLGLSPGLGRAVPRRPHNRLPTLEAPSTIRAAEGRAAATHLRAIDPDGDAISFYVQRVPAFPPRLRELAMSVLTDHGNATAELEFTPRHDEAGQYPLRVAAFDDGGGVVVQDVTFIIEDTQPEGDANCDGQLRFDDIPSIIAALFDPSVYRECVSADTTDDGQVRVNDLVALLARLAR